MVTTKITLESVLKLSSDPSIALQVNTLIKTMVVSLVLDLARLVLQPLNAQLVPLLDILPTQLEYVLQNVVMDSLLVVKLVIPETKPHLDVAAAKFKVDGLAQDNPQSVNQTNLLLLKFPQLQQIQSFLILLLILQLEFPLSINLEMLPSTQTTCSSHLRQESHSHSRMKKKAQDSSRAASQECQVLLLQFTVLKELVHN